MFEATPIAGLTIVRPRRHGDARGFFSEVWNARAFADAGLGPFDWCQDNHSHSAAPWVLRGLHYQAPPSAQAKLVRCSRGRVWDVAVDMRRGSPTEGRSYGIELSAENWAQLLIPKGFLHGFLTLEPDCEVQYKVDAPYDAGADGAVAWNDPALGIDWPLASHDPVLSDKDRAAPTLEDWQSPFRWED